MRDRAQRRVLEVDWPKKKAQSKEHLGNHSIGDSFCRKRMKRDTKAPASLLPTNQLDSPVTRRKVSTHERDAVRLEQYETQEAPPRP